jgi:hypothetical protein
VVEDRGWSAIGRQWRIDYKAARSWVITAIKALAELR